MKSHHLYVFHEYDIIVATKSSSCNSIKCLALEMHGLSVVRRFVFTAPFASGRQSIGSDLYSGAGVLAEEVANLGLRLCR